MHCNQSIYDELFNSKVCCKLLWSILDVEASSVASCRCILSREWMECPAGWWWWPLARFSGCFVMCWRKQSRNNFSTAYVNHFLSPNITIFFSKTSLPKLSILELLATHSSPWITILMKIGKTGSDWFCRFTKNWLVWFIFLNRKFWKTKTKKIKR
jgi:hypothetical protein